MPRKATPQSPDMQKIIALIKEYCANNNLNVLALSREVGVSQPALYRFVNGERKTITLTARKCMDYVNTRHNRHKTGEIARNPTTDDGYGLIENAAKSLWDGDPCTAKLVASIIRALKPTIEIATAAIKGST